MYLYLLHIKKPPNLFVHTKKRKHHTIHSLLILKKKEKPIIKIKQLNNLNLFDSFILSTLQELLAII